MAKITLENGMVFEGSNDELVELFTKLGAKIPAVEATTITAPSIYRKVADRKPCEGDYVKFSETDDDDITVGKYYEIISFDFDNDPEFVDDNGDVNCGEPVTETFEIYEKVGAEPAPTALLKVGDYAKFIKKDGGAGGVDVGDVIEIIGTGSAFDFEFKRVSDGKFSLTNAVNLIRATDEEVAEAKAQQAEKAVAAKWASINRKPNEFKKGDIVAYSYNRWFENEGIGEVQYGLDEDGEYLGARIVALQSNGRLVDYYLENKHLTLITPVEARFDLSSKGDR